MEPPRKLPMLILAEVHVPEAVSVNPLGPLEILKRARGEIAPRAP